MAKTSNPKWYQAKNALGIIPPPPNSPQGTMLLDLVGETYLTQGPLAGRQFKEVALPWQQRIIRWIPHVDEIPIKCGKGSGKSFMVASIALGIAKQWLVEGSHQRGLIAIVAANVESARIVFSHIFEAILYDDREKKLWHPNVQQRSLTHKENGVTVQILPPKLNRAIGLRPSLLIIDELHEAAEVIGFEDVIRQLRLGGKNWEDFKEIVITTAPPGPGKGYYVEWLSRARAVRDEKVKNDRLLPCLFEFPILQRPDLDFEDPKNWYFGMPSLMPRKGAKGTMLVSTMVEELNNAQDDMDVAGSGNYQAVLSQRLGIEAAERVGGGLTLLAEFWGNGVVGSVPEGYDQIVIGLDPSEGLRDPFGGVILYSFSGTEMMAAESRQWLTEEGYRRASRHLKRYYDDAIDEGELHICKTDLDIENAVHAWCQGITTKTGIPPTYGGDAAGLAGFMDRFVRLFGGYEPVPQGWKLLAAFNAAQGALHAGRLRHLNQTMLTMNIRNLRMEGGRLVKADHASFLAEDKIDGAMALLSAIYILKMTPNINPVDWIG